MQTWLLITDPYTWCVLILGVLVLASFIWLIIITGKVRPNEGPENRLIGSALGNGQSVQSWARSNGYDMRKGASVTRYKVVHTPLFERLAHGDQYKLDTWFLCSECEEATIISYTNEADNVHYCPSCGAVFMHTEDR